MSDHEKNGFIHGGPIADCPACSPRKHNTDVGALDCWCLLTYRKPCDECDGKGRDGFGSYCVDCWKCYGHGTLPISREEAEKMNGGVIIVHKEEEE